MENEHGHVKTRQRKQLNQQDPSILKGKSSALEREVNKYLGKSDEPLLSDPVVAGAQIGQFQGLTFEKNRREKNLLLLMGPEAKDPSVSMKSFRTTCNSKNVQSMSLKKITIAALSVELLFKGKKSQVILQPVQQVKWSPVETAPLHQRSLPST